MKWSGRSAIAIAGVCAAATMFSGTAQASPLWEPLQPVANLDVARYVGEWNQVAAIPQPFSLACAKDTRASYGIVDSSNVSVKNTCTTWTGQANEIVGNARVTDPATGAQLHVSFPGVPSQESLDGPPNYIVTYIADDYSWALVGDPLRLSGFVLSRSAVIDAAGWTEIPRAPEPRGYQRCTSRQPRTPARR